jgi:hypothetical protein
MELHYKLTTAKNSTRGVLQEDTHLILDFKESCIINFCLMGSKTLPDDNYYVTFIDSLLQKTHLQIVDSKITLPTKLWREQTLKVIVNYYTDGKITKTWYCNPLKLAFMDNIQKATLTIGADVYEVLERVVSVENEVNALKERMTTLESQSMDTFKASILQQLTDIVNSHNKLVEEVAQIKSELSL